MKFNNKALKEARNLVAYAIRETAGFRVNMSCLEVGYKYKDSPYAANMLLSPELKKRGITDMDIYFEPTRKNRCWRNAALRMKKHPQVKPAWQYDYLIGGKFHLKSPLFLIPLRAISKVIGGNLPQTVIELKEFAPLDGYILDGKFKNY